MTRRILTTTVLVAAFAAAGLWAQSQVVTLVDSTVVSLYRGTSKVSDHPSWEACRAQAVTLAKADTRTSGSVTYSCKTEVRKLVATYSTAPLPQPVNCVVSDWSLQSASAWSTCTGGTQTRTETWARSVVTPAANGGTACPALTETRTATQACTVTPPPCTFSVAPTTVTAPATGASGVLTVSAAPSGCAPATWTASSPVSWVTLSSSATQTSYTVLAHTDTAARTATLAIAGVPVTVSQAAPVVIPQPTDLLFANGWDSVAGPTPVCDFANLTDNRAWADYGGAGACSGTVHDADIVSDVFADGGRSLRVTQKAGNQNGTDFRIVRTFGSQAEVTAVWKVRYAENWRWATADHKIVIFTDAQATAQNVYVNWRGGSSPTQGRIAVHVIPSDTVLTDRSIEATVGRWYRIRTHIVAGSAGKVEVWLTDCGVTGTDAACAAATERKLSLTVDAGNAADPNRLNTGQIGGIKPDTTYNAGSNIPAGGFYQWYDSIRVYRGLFLGQ